MIGREKNLFELSKEERDARAENRVGGGGGLRVENPVGKTRGKTWHLVTDIFTPGLTAGNPLALPALNHSIVFGRRARFMPASTLHYGARGGPTDRPRGVRGRGKGGGRGRGTEPSPVELASIAHVPATLSIPRIHYAPTRSPGTRLSDGERVSRRPRRRRSGRLSISAIAIEARWVRRACRWTCAWIMHNVAPP